MKRLTDRKIGRLSTIILILLVVFPAIILSQVIKQVNDALISGDTTTAISLLEEQIKLDPSFSENYYILGEINLSRKQFQEAEQQFQLSFDKNNRFFEGLYALGMVQLRLSKVENAGKNFDLGLKKSPKNLKAAFYNGLGLYHIAKGDYSTADKELRQAIISDSTVAEYHVNLGDANLKMKVYPLAMSEYEKAIRLDTTFLEVYFHLAEACLEMKDYNAALENLKTVLRRDSTHAEAWMQAGGIYYKAARSARTAEDTKQRFMEAIGSYKKYMELVGGKPDSATGRAYYETGMSYLMLGPVGCEDAKKYFSIVLAIPVEPKDIYFYYGRAFGGCGQYDSALAYFQKHIDWANKQGENFKSAIGDDELYRRIGEAYENMKDYQNAITHYRKSLDIDSTQERILYGVAVAYNYLGDYRNALGYYMKRIALGVDEKSWYIYYNAATAALYLAEKTAQGERPKAIDSTLNSGPDPLVGINFAQLAADYLEKVIQFKADNIKAMAMLASTYLYQLSKCPEAIALYQKVLTAEPENCEALKSLGYAHFAGLCQRNYSLALDYLNRALNCLVKKSGSECKDADLLLWIAQTYHFRAVEKRDAKQKDESKKDFKAAFDWYKRMLKCDPGNKAAMDGHDQVKFEF
ncbi:MAG: tetratricopeptide repeat protein [candidate division Zixibacteria bacterium]|nr:tetratricopeptide repeat protein [candidate division Zixibacteria bacterium]